MKVLPTFREKFDFVTEIRGEGLMVGVQLSMDGQPFVDEALGGASLINCTHQTTLRLVPPFIITLVAERTISERMELCSQENARGSAPQRLPSLSCRTDAFTAGRSPHGRTRGREVIEHEHLSPSPFAITRDLLTGMEWPASSVRELFHLSADVKSHPKPIAMPCQAAISALIFEKPSLRTRTTFDVGMQSLGGGAVFLDHTMTHLGRARIDQDVAKNLERWVQGIVARTFDKA